MSSLYLAILGRQPELGLLELECRLEAEAVVGFGQHAFVNQEIQLDSLGGALKLARVIYQGPVRDLVKLDFEESLPWPQSGKINLGLSFYGSRLTTREVMAAGLELKKRWRSRGSLRLVTPQSGTSLSAAQLLHNGLPGKGFELVVVQAKGQMAVGVTEQVQDIEAYASRDYGRPARSPKVGMLPPKLAQILVNTTSAPLVADPFCGTGVVLQEALLLGRQVYGSDLAADMVAASRTNLEWLAGRHSNLPSWAVEQADAGSWTPPSGCAIVTEGYLGPAFSRLPRPDEVAAAQTELTKFYRRVLASWAKHLTSGAEVTLCLPSWRTAKAWADLPIIDELPDLGYTFRQFAQADSSQLRYARPDQIVGRRILPLLRS